MKTLTLCSLVMLLLACNEKTQQEQIKMEPVAEILVEDFLKNQKKPLFVCHLMANISLI